MNRISKRWANAIYVAIAALLVTAPADARGSVRVQQVDGRVQEYHNVVLQLHGTTLRIRTADRIGTLIVQRAACMFIGGLERCLPSSLELSQRGNHPIAFQRGTLYVNLTNDPHTLPHSSKTLAPQSVLALLKTVHGTYIAVSGHLDEVTP